MCSQFLCIYASLCECCVRECTCAGYYSRNKHEQPSRYAFFLPPPKYFRCNMFTSCTSHYHGSGLLDSFFFSFNYVLLFIFLFHYIWVINYWHIFTHIHSEFPFTAVLPLNIPSSFEVKYVLEYNPNMGTGPPTNFKKDICKVEYRADCVLKRKETLFKHNKKAGATIKVTAPAPSSPLAPAPPVMMLPTTLSVRVEMIYVWNLCARVFMIYFYSVHYQVTFKVLFANHCLLHSHI
jgi:hypothetical protein